MAVSVIDQPVRTPPHMSAVSTPALTPDGDVEKNLSSSSSNDAAASVDSMGEEQRAIKGFKVGRTLG